MKSLGKTEEKFTFSIERCASYKQRTALLHCMVKLLSSSMSQEIRGYCCTSFFLGSRDFKKRTLVLLTSPRHSPIVNTPSLYNRHPKNPPNTPTNALNKTWASKKVYKKDR